MEPNRNKFQEDRYRQLVAQILEERFPEAFPSIEIILEPSVDFYGEDYIHTYVVVDGDFKKLDPAKALGISTMLWPESKEMGYVGFPMQSYIKKSEWVRTARKRAR